MQWHNGILHLKTNIETSAQSLFGSEYGGGGYELGEVEIIGEAPNDDNGDDDWGDDDDNDNNDYDWGGNNDKDDDKDPYENIDDPINSDDDPKTEETNENPSGQGQGLDHLTEKQRIDLLAKWSKYNWSNNKVYVVDADGDGFKDGYIYKDKNGVIQYVPIDSTGPVIITPDGKIEESSFDPPSEMVKWDVQYKEDDADYDKGGGGGSSESEPSSPNEDKDCNSADKEPAERMKKIADGTKDVREKIDSLRMQAKILSGPVSSKEYSFNTIYGMKDGKDRFYTDDIVEGEDDYMPTKTMGRSVFTSHHTHSILGFSGPSVVDVNSTLSLIAAMQKQYPNGDYNYHGTAIYAGDGSDDLLYLDPSDRAQAVEFMEKNPDGFEINKKGLFNTSALQSSHDLNFNKIYTNIISQGFTENDAFDHAMAYILERIKTGLVIYKRDMPSEELRKISTEKIIDENGKTRYKPKKCPQ